jgi:hypothetical protein
MKQTIQKPDASLSAGRRGTLNLPDLDKSFNYELRSELGQKKKTENMEESGDEETLEKKEKKMHAYPAFPYGVICLFTSRERNG